MYEDLIVDYPTLEQVELAESTLEFIKANPILHRQTSWAANSDYFTLQVGQEFDPWALPWADRFDWAIADNICGTAACFAGWSAARHGYLVAATDGFGVSAFEFHRVGQQIVLDTEVGSVNKVAAGLLGLRRAYCFNEEGTELLDDEGGSDLDNGHPFDGGNSLDNIEVFVRELRARYESNRDAGWIPTHAG